ncbi:RNA polymerase III subunit C82 [Dimargaris cristalligena]|uniref:DNA-directed RNA polymerase III subunit RPC3 n=1 Tax=Dimargaris cristalligena TaxID=215637 RepID=A0A4P9ZPY0_9FUNG|nr:RNA polymerase III subunit C82 [Dimargaris cristalligena]RKP35258.1 RNA polymerase III subunit RPC82-domain-containing protein [Dimargaris cristalligena]|eukprot:RKP35258.1 RNA polymerase III subunit RPC82-domain-containing protein [Dimargaris cristalligena]
MSDYELNLTRAILGDHFGPVVESVGHLLARKGRLPLPLIVRDSGLKLKQVREALVVMIQHNLATWAEAPMGPRLIVFYQASIRAILMRQRIGDSLKTIVDLHDGDGLTIMNHVLVQGKITPEALKAKLDWKKLTVNRRLLYTEVLHALIRLRFIEAVQHSDSVSVDDRVMKEDAEAKDKLSAMPSAAEITKAKKLRMEKAEAEYQQGNLVGMKRKIADSSDTSALKIRVGSFEMVEEVDETMHFRVNFERFNLYLRNHQIVDLVQERTNRSGGAIVRAMLGAVEEKMRSTHEENSPPVTLVQITHQLPKDNRITEDIELSTAGLDRGEVDIHGGDNRSQDVVRQFLEVLRHDSGNILYRDELRGGGQFRINFTRARQQLTERLLFSYLEEKFGILSCRIMRILNEKGKMDDKQLAKFALLPVKDVRKVVHELMAHNFVSLQEIPKTADRTPITCFYLFFTSVSVSTDACLQLHYKELTNLYSRMFYERTLRSRLLAKTQREDVQQDQSLLSPADKRALEALENTMNLLQGSILRLDRQVLLLRDIA